MIFQGNVRELENILEHAFVLCRGGIIELHHLPTELQPQVPDVDLSLGATDIKTMEKHLISAALHRQHGNRKLAAKDLGINVATLYRKIKSLAIQPPPSDGRSRTMITPEQEY